MNSELENDVRVLMWGLVSDLDKQEVPINVTGATMLGISLTIAVRTGAKKEELMEFVGKTFDAVTAQVMSEKMKGDKADEQAS